MVTRTEKPEIKYFFENPNTAKEIENLLRKIIVEKLLLLHIDQPQVQAN